MTESMNEPAGDKADEQRMDGGGPEAASGDSAPAPAADVAALEARAIEVLRSCYDPEIPVNIYDLGLIYEVKAEEGGKVYVRMTLTSPMCPVAETLPVEVETRIQDLEGVSDVVVEVVWDPPWTPDMMSEDARLELNMF